MKKKKTDSQKLKAVNLCIFFKMCIYKAQNYTILYRLIQRWNPKELYPIYFLRIETAIVQQALSTLNWLDEKGQLRW